MLSRFSTVYQASRRAILGGIGAALLAAGVLAGQPAAAEQEKLTIVTTTGMIADAVKEVGGERVEVTALMGPGVDPHAYRQTRSDIVAMAQADLVLWHGLFLEAQMEEFLRELEAEDKAVAVGEALDQAILIGHDDYADKKDPHVWMDPALWAGVVTAVRDALIEKNPSAKAVFEENAAAHLAKVDELGAYAKGVMASVPEASRLLLTAHDAFNYFGAAYGFEVMGIQGISTESEAGLQRISELVTLLVERDVKAVFVESSVSDRNIRALIEGAAAKGHEVVVGGELFSDAMGELGTYEGTYIGMIDHNVTTIAGALDGKVPENGMSGLLN